MIRKDFKIYFDDESTQGVVGKLGKRTTNMKIDEYGEVNEGSKRSKTTTTCNALAVTARHSCQQ